MGILRQLCAHAIRCGLHAGREGSANWIFCTRERGNRWLLGYRYGISGSGTSIVVLTWEVTIQPDEHEEEPWAELLLSPE